MKAPVRFAAAITAVFFVATALCVPVGAAYAAESKSPQPSKALAKPLHDIQDLLQAKKYSEAIPKLHEAEGIAGKTPYDQHIINEFLRVSYLKTNDLPNAAKAIEAEVDDSFTPEHDKSEFIRSLAEIHYQLKNYDKAIDYGTRAIKGGFADEQMKILVGQAYYLKADYKGTHKYLDGYIDAQVKAGETPKKDMLLLDYSACQKMNDDACSTHAMERLVAYYPQPDYWKQLLYGVRQSISNNDAATLQTYRLMSEVDVLNSPSDYNEMAQLALEAGSPGEAQAVLQKGFDKGVFNDKLTKDRNQRLLDNAKKVAGTDQQSLPKQEADADKAATGAGNVGVGIAYLGYGQFDKAADELSKGLQKGGLKDENQARLLLGIAQLKGGHKDDAIKTFKTVKGDPTLERLASLWQLHARQA
jgi:tetratricopeptide (TPR) repeat protein